METEKEKKAMDDRNDGVDANEETEALEILLFQVSECYVYLIPPRKSAASYSADEWNVNKWAWEGTLKVLSKGEECIIRLEDKSTGELYARAFLRKGELHPVEPVIDSSRYFVLRIEENMDGHLRHAFIGIGFRERTEAYDFQVALHDHIKYYSIYYPYAFVLKLFVVFLSFKFLVDYAANYSNDNLMHFLTLFWRYLDKKKTAEEMEQQFRKTSTVDYSLKDGETLHLQLKNKSSGRVKSKFFEQGLNNLSLEDKGNPKEPVICIKLPPPPPASLSPGTAAPKSPSNSPPNLCLEGTSNEESPDTSKEDSKELHSPENQSTQDIPDDDFGDFQAAG